MANQINRFCNYNSGVGTENKIHRRIFRIKKPDEHCVCVNGKTGQGKLPILENHSAENQEKGNAPDIWPDI